MGRGCLIKQIVITTSTSELLAFNTSLNGVCLGETSFSNIIDYSSGYTSTFTTNSITVSIILSNDRSALVISNSLMSDLFENTYHVVLPQSLKLQLAKLLL